MASADGRYHLVFNGEIYNHRARRQLLLARDPHGIKPLYYADDGGTLRFASQVKALLAGGADRFRIRGLFA